MLDVTLGEEARQRVMTALDGLVPGARIVVAMSGGVDSSVTALLIKSLGFDAIGITLQLYDHGAAVGRKGACCAGVDIHDARRVAAAIGMPHYVLDYERRFRSAVIDTFADSYLAGETPVPCIACNQTVKFGDLASTARELGAAALVTGHYVGWRMGAEGPELCRAEDPARDQSYFLFSTPRSALDLVRFPLGGLPKPEVRAIADAAGLAIASKPDSQDICFVPNGRYADVIEKLRPGAAEPGDIVHVDGRRLGSHPGIVHFTVGQRRGIGVTAGEALYVVRIEPATRRVIVGPRAALAADLIRLREVNWLGPGTLEAFAAGCGRIFARVRSTHSPQPGCIELTASGPIVRLDHSEFGIARGQACVFYSDGGPEARLLGGGWITGTELTERRSTSAIPLASTN